MYLDNSIKHILRTKLNFTQWNILILERNMELSARVTGFISLLKKSENPRQIMPEVKRQLNQIRQSLENENQKSSEKLLRQAYDEYYSFDSVRCLTA